MRPLRVLAVLACALSSCGRDGQKPMPGLVNGGACPRLDAGAGPEIQATSDASCLPVLGTYDGVDDIGMPTDVLAISVRWSPVDDLALMGSEGRVRLFRVDVGAGTITELARDDGPRDRVFVAWSPDGRFALTGSLDVRLLSVASSPPSLEELAIYSGHRGSVYAVNFSPDGKHALTGGEDGTVRLLGVDGVRGSLTELAVHDGYGDKVYEATWSPDGTSAWTASQDGTLRWLDVDVERGTLHERAILREGVAVTAVAPSPDGTHVVWGTWVPCATTKLGSCESNRVEVREELVHQPSGLRAVVWRSDGKSVLVGGHDDIVRLYDFRTNQLVPVAALRDYPWGVHSISLSADDAALLVASSKRDRVTLVGLQDCH